ncbi:unnamed protein product, partial [Rotaria sp. Silwood1]
QVEAWAKELGMTAVHGPLGFTDLDHEGMLVEGFDQLGTLATIYNHPYYPKYMETLGYAKDTDWVEYKLFIPQVLPPSLAKMAKLAEVVQRRYKLKFVETKKTKDILPYANQIFELINETYADLYGVVPLTQKQMDVYTKQYFGFVKHNYLPLVVDENNQLVSFGVTMPSLSKALQKSASGFIGSCLVEKAIEKGYQTFAVIRKNSNKQYLQNPAINFVEFDFNNAASLDKALQDFKAQFGIIDYVIHAAGVTKSINKQDFYNGNYDSTKNLVEALERNGVVPDKFVLVSSLAAFGCGETDEPITKHQAQKPLTEYGKSKMQAENYLRSKTNFPFVIVNPTAVNVH